MHVKSTGMVDESIKDVDYEYEINFEDYYGKRFKMEYDENEKRWKPSLFYAPSNNGQYIWDIEPCRVMREKKQLNEPFSIRERRVLQVRAQNSNARVFIGEDIVKYCPNFVMLSHDK